MKTLKDQLVAMQVLGEKEGKTREWMACLILHWMDSEVACSLDGNGWLDNDPATADRLYDQEYSAFVRKALGQV